MSRHKARETALKMLFQMDVGENSLEMAGHTLHQAALGKGLMEFALGLVTGAEANNGEIDQYLTMFAKEWQIDRLANVDRNILRLAIYELLYAKETPANIVMDEAIELAKTYSTAEAPAFINAILDGFYHKVVLEDRADFRIDQQALQHRSQLAAAEAEKIAKLAAAEQVAVVETVPKPAKPKAQHQVVYDKTKKVVDGQSYRIIKKAEQTAADKIGEESILEDKKRLFGEAAYLTEKDLRKAAESGQQIPKEDLLAYQKQEDAEAPKPKEPFKRRADERKGKQPR